MQDPGKPSSYGTVTIVGVGLIGGSLALALRRQGHRCRILGVSRPRSLDEARRLGAIDEGFPYEGLEDAAAQSDLIVLATPISRILEHLRVLGAIELRPGTVVTDVGSTKRVILETAEEHLPEAARFIGGHPLAGSEQRGMGAADPFLFENAYYVLTPSGSVPEAEIDRLASLVRSIGARAVVLSADEHDRVAAAISHLPQLLAVHLVNSLDRLDASRESAIRLAAGGFRDMTRIASSPFSVWRDIFETNREEIARSLVALCESLREESDDLKSERLTAAFERAAATRAEIPTDTKGFLHRLWDLLVEVEDTPGMIARLANPLAAKGINVLDIEVLKVREGEGGTLRLSFATRELAEEASRELERAGFRPRIRH